MGVCHSNPYVMACHGTSGSGSFVMVVCQSNAYTASFLCRGDPTRTDDPHALRDALANCYLIIIKVSFSASFFNELFQFNSF